MKMPFVIFALLCLPSLAYGQNQTGYQPNVAVSSVGQLDWVFVVANQSPPAVPRGWLEDYEAKEQSYELFVPAGYTAQRAWPVVIFISPGNRSTGFKSWQSVCERQGIIFAGVHGAGNQVETRRRVRIVLDVLADVRRRFHTDVDRTYISGFSGGGRIAGAVAFALPEHFGGVVPICAGADLRDETWLKQRCIDRMSVAMITGETDFNRGEVERFRGPMLRDIGVRTRVWTVSKLGHALPPAETLGAVYDWLDEAARQRASLAGSFPASKANGSPPPDRESQCRSLFAEGRQRLAEPKTVYSGLMLLKGVMTRWPDLPEARKAREVLLEFDGSEDGDWREHDVAFQRRVLIARARGLDAYASGDLPANYARMRKDMAMAARQLWQQIIDDGQDPPAVAEARRRVTALQALIEQD